jgi:hypothetical protein
MSKIELIHYRDPDAECDHALFIDGVKVEFAYTSMDPGAGWERSQWNEHVNQSLAELSPAAREFAEGWFESASESEHIDDPDAERSL